MKKPLADQEEPFLLTFADLRLVLKKNAYKIAFGICACALLALYYGLTRPIEYQVEGTFKEKGKSASGVGKVSTAALLLGVDSADSDALSTMKSRSLFEELVKQQGLQAIVAKAGSQSSLLPWQHMQHNLLVEYALYTKAKEPVLADPKNDLLVSNISYQGELPLNVRLIFKDEHHYDAVDSHGQLLGTGTLGSPLATEAFAALIARGTEEPLTGQEYHLTLTPLGPTAEALAKLFVIESDRFDKSLIRITYRHRDRHQAAAHVNALMDVYKNHIHNAHERLCSLQVDYLVQRQKEMGEHLEAMMRGYAEDLSQGLSSTGFSTSDNAINFLAANQQSYKQRLMAIALEIQQLEHIQSQGKVSYDKLMLVQNADFINKLTAEIRALKQQADALDLAVRSHDLDRQGFQEAFARQIAELEEIKLCAQEAKALVAELAQDRHPSPPAHLLDNPKFMVRAWYDRLTDAASAPAGATWHSCKDSMASYMNHLVHYLNVHQRSIEERLAHQQLPVSDFQGINLATAEELYISYSKQLSELESKAAQQRFITEHIHDPDFEISSLSTVLNDAVSADMIANASNTILALRDLDNRSAKEQDRLRTELAIQKGFLTTHLKQAVQLSELQQNLTKESIRALQSATLSLIQEQTSILESHIAEFIAERLASLKQEQHFLNLNLADIRQEMSSFPHKWVAEQLINHQMEVNQNMVEEISKLVESKNIANNLEKIQSAPVDLPLTPVHPKSPRLLLLTALGGVAGGFISIALVLMGSVAGGIAASPENLRLAGQHVAGRLRRAYRLGLTEDPMLDSDLDTLRRLIAFAGDGAAGAAAQHALLLLMGTGPDYAANLAELMAKKGLKVLLLDLYFGASRPHGEQSPTEGLLQYLESTGQRPPSITHGPHFDSVAAGGMSRYACELLGSEKFKGLLDEYLKTYDWVIGSSKAAVGGAEAEVLLDIFPAAAVSVMGETLPQLKACMEHPDKKVSFVLIS